MEKGILEFGLILPDRLHACRCVTNAPSGMHIIDETSANILAEKKTR